MEPHVLLDVRENAFERIGRVGDVQVWMIQVHEEMGKIPLHAVVGTPNSAVCVMPSLRQLIRRSLLEERSPLVVPEPQPECELRFTDVGKMPHERLQILPCFEFGTASDVPCDNGGLMKMTHLHRHRKALQQATSAITDNRSDFPSNGFQHLDAVLVRADGFVGQELPEEILVSVRTAPDHDAEESPEVCGVHDDDDLIRCQLLLRDDDIL